jgi:hypothetical protein
METGNHDGWLQRLAPASGCAAPSRDLPAELRTPELGIELAIGLVDNHCE